MTALSNAERKQIIADANKSTLTLDGVTIEVKSHPKDRQVSNFGPVQTRAYIWFDKESEHYVPHQALRDRNIWLRKYVITPLAEKLNIGLEKIKYDSYAGCGCGCSPGFKLKAKVNTPFNLYVTVK